MVAPAVRRFRKRITCDPNKVTATWVGDNVCNFKGFRCFTVPNFNQLGVSGVEFNRLGFCGNKNQLVLKDFLENLVDVVYFHANSNNVTGPQSIPRNISRIEYFYEFDLSNNKLRGVFPQAVLGAKNLTFLDLRFNFLTGPIPPEAFTLDLEVLFLNNNMFTGKIPENLGKTPALYLTLANNKLTGPIPSSIGQANKTLLEVLFLGNRLSGCLPYQIGYLKKTTIFDASINKLTGPIPKSFGCLRRMEQLNLSHNRLYGAIPETLCDLPHLKALTLNNNYFTEVGPECRELIKKHKLDVRKNCIRDLPSQRTEDECEEFFSEKASCPNERTLLSFVPCKASELVKEDVSKGTLAPAIAPAPSPTYAALNRHR